MKLVALDPKKFKTLRFVNLDGSGAIRVRADVAQYLVAMEQLAKSYGIKTIQINSGFADRGHSDGKGGEHKHGNAIDIQWRGVSQDQRNRMLRMFQENDMFQSYGLTGSKGKKARNLPGHTDHVHVILGGKPSGAPQYQNTRWNAPGTLVGPVAADYIRRRAPFAASAIAEADPGVRGTNAYGSVDPKQLTVQGYKNGRPVFIRGGYDPLRDVGPNTPEGSFTRQLMENALNSASLGFHKIDPMDQTNPLATGLGQIGGAIPMIAATTGLGAGLGAAAGAARMGSLLRAAPALARLSPTLAAAPIAEAAGIGRAIGAVGGAALGRAAVGGGQEYNQQVTELQGGQRQAINPLRIGASALTEGLVDLPSPVGGSGLGRVLRSAGAGALENVAAEGVGAMLPGERLRTEQLPMQAAIGAGIRGALAIPSAMAKPNTESLTPIPSPIAPPRPQILPEGASVGDLVKAARVIAEQPLAVPSKTMPGRFVQRPPELAQPAAPPSRLGSALQPEEPSVIPQAVDAQPPVKGFPTPQEVMAPPKAVEPELPKATPQKLTTDSLRRPPEAPADSPDAIVSQREQPGTTSYDRQVRKLVQGDSLDPTPGGMTKSELERAKGVYAGDYNGKPVVYDGKPYTIKKSSGGDLTLNPLEEGGKPVVVRKANREFVEPLLDRDRVAEGRPPLADSLKESLVDPRRYYDLNRETSYSARGYNDVPGAHKPFPGDDYAEVGRNQPPPVKQEPEAPREEEVQQAPPEKVTELKKPPPEPEAIKVEEPVTKAQPEAPKKGKKGKAEDSGEAPKVEGEKAGSDKVDPKPKPDEPVSPRDAKVGKAKDVEAQAPKEKELGTKDQGEGGNKAQGGTPKIDEETAPPKNESEASVAKSEPESNKSAPQKEPPQEPTVSPQSRDKYAKTQDTSEFMAGGGPKGVSDDRGAFVSVMKGKALWFEKTGGKGPKGTAVEGLVLPNPVKVAQAADKFIADKTTLQVHYFADVKGSTTSKLKEGKATMLFLPLKRGVSKGQPALFGLNEANQPTILLINALDRLETGEGGASVIAGIKKAPEGFEIDPSFVNLAARDAKRQVKTSSAMTKISDAAKQGVKPTVLKKYGAKRVADMVAKQFEGVNLADIDEGSLKKVIDKINLMKTSELNALKELTGCE